MILESQRSYPLYVLLLPAPVKGNHHHIILLTKIGNKAQLGHVASGYCELYLLSWVVHHNLLFEGNIAIDSLQSKILLVQVGWLGCQLY